jgi:radical SAM-linked protein
MRLRITFSKTGSLRYIGHLDLQQVWERTARRAGLPLAYTQGFHPGPKIQIAAALPLGFSGRAEVVDLWLRDDTGSDVPAQGGRESGPCIDRLQSAAPPGLKIVSVEEVDERAPALQSRVAAAEYEVTLTEVSLGSELPERAAALLAKSSLPRQRRGRDYDLRPLILSLECRGSPPDAQGQVPAFRIYMRLSAREGATGRPEEVLAELGIPPEAARIERTRLILKDEVE